MDFLTVGDLRRAIKDVPDTILVAIENADDTVVVLSSDVAAVKDLEDNLTMLTVSIYLDEDDEPVDAAPEEDDDEPEPTGL